jgi:hypothetical protein
VGNHEMSWFRQEPQNCAGRGDGIVDRVERNPNTHFRAGGMMAPLRGGDIGSGG